MNSLIIDCSAGMSVYLLKNKEVFSKIDENQKKHTDELLFVVDELLHDSELKISDLNNLCVCVGPGSFTGIRVAISIVKGLAIGINAKVVVLTNFDIYDTENKTNSLLVLEGFSKFVYARISQNGIIKDECVEIQELAERVKNDKFNIYVQDEKVQKLLNNYEIKSNIAQKQTILRFLEKLNNDDFLDLNQIEPIYLRASQAEIERNKKLAGDK